MKKTNKDLLKWLGIKNGQFVQMSGFLLKAENDKLVWKHGEVDPTRLINHDYEVCDSEEMKKTLYEHIKSRYEAYKWVARDKNGILNLFMEEPIKENDRFVNTFGKKKEILDYGILFQEIDFDSGARKIEEILK